MTTTPASPHLFFKGRDGDPRLGEWAIKSKAEDLSAANESSIVFFGSPDDTGVRLNLGRPGAKGGPDAVRAALYKFAWPLSKNLAKTNWFDIGNIEVNTDILRTHQVAFETSQAAAASGARVIAVGGGHDFAFPHISGMYSGLPRSKIKKNALGIINVDPHLDVRDLNNNQPHSGTPFRQLIESGTVQGSNLIQFGAREGRNAVAHFEYCRSKNVKVEEFSKLRNSGRVIQKFKAHLAKLGASCQHLAVTIDMDSCADIEGVSAAPVIGFSPWELCQFAKFSGLNPKVKILELAEIAPELDPSGRAGRIGAEIIFHFLLGHLSSKIF